MPWLFLLTEGAEPLPWDIRLKVAIGAAKGLAFLHSEEESVIYRDFKASNILLDAVKDHLLLLLSLEHTSERTMMCILIIRV